MTHGVVTCIRTVLAFAVGAACDLILFADAYPYDERHQYQQFIGINVLWLTPLIALVCAFALDLKGRHQRGGSPAPGRIAGFDSLGLLIPSAMATGLTITHTIVLIRDLTIDPTTHNLFPFEYIFGWIMVGVPSIAGSMLARGMSWAFNRLRSNTTR